MKGALISLLLATVVIRLVLVAALVFGGDPSPFAFGDSKGYLTIAENLHQGNGFSQVSSPPYLLDSSRTPVMPYVFAATKAVFGSFTPFVLVQAVLAGVLVYLTFLIALLVTKREKLALGAAALMAFEPYAIFINTSLLTETLYAVLVTLAAYLVLLYIERRSPWPLAAASALFALAALTRPLAQFMPALLVALVLWREPLRSSGRFVVAALVPFLLVVGPWVLRNHVTFGITAISSGGLQNVYSDLGATILVYDEGGVWRDKKNWLEADFAARHGIPVDTIQQNLELSPVLFREGLGIMLTHPKGTAKSFLAISLAFLTSDVWTFYPQKWGWMEPFSLQFSPTQSLLNDGPVVTLGRVLEASGSAALAIALAGRIFWVVTMLLFFAGLWSLWRQGGLPRSFTVIALVSVFYYLGLVWSAGAGVNGRYRYPLDPLIFTAAVVGAAALVQRLRSVLGWHKGI
ncbi:hypothetical protein FJY94_05805 [Candidatus Kaiserbacteria bacterium]|nr:hypothetical protein [Candidatus Kaiserbacteria bacterium]